ncbi:hypothetical protein BC936DRAFT_147729 [Jimgerdemannia flammicorona]|uniref:F-box domain-containing protein n=1 Tax=Jimgerdemannia flammicorona TaxID=994334 RepID=A0A433D4M9_9FUNG|nr:hypothetical protein BC936DRAFT_147729 [Jimgerdemannia flammicorona]
MRAEAEMRACGGAVDGPPRASGFTSPTCVPFVCAEMGDASRTSTRVPRWRDKADCPWGIKYRSDTALAVSFSTPRFHQQLFRASTSPPFRPTTKSHSPPLNVRAFLPTTQSPILLIREPAADTTAVVVCDGHGGPAYLPAARHGAAAGVLVRDACGQVPSGREVARIQPTPTYSQLIHILPTLTPPHPTPLHSILTPLHSILTPLHSILTPLHSILTSLHSNPNPSSPLPTTPHSLLLPTPYYSPLPTTPYFLLLPTPYSLLLPTPYHSPLSSTCRYWHNLASDPHLFRHVHIADLEFRPLVLLLRELYRLATGLRSLTISNCFSDFLKNTTVPMGHVPGLRHHGQLFSHITVLRPERRREEYAIQGFTLHREFSDALLDLMRQNEQHLRALRLHDCHLDLEMSDLVFAIVRYGRALEEIAYENNSDRGLGSQSSLSAIVAACPNIRTFRGVHDAMGDAVLTRMATGWRELRCLTVANGRPAAGDAYDNEAGACGIISSEAFWKLLTECPQLEELELLDLECVSNQNLAAYVHMAAAVAEQRLSSTLSTTRRDHMHQHHPYRRARSSYSYSAPPALPGSRLATVNITKNTSHPLSLSGFQSLVALFPSLRRLDYKTTFAAFDNEFENITPYENVRATVAEWFAEQAPQIKYDGCWTVETFVARMNVVPQEMV